MTHEKNDRRKLCAALFGKPAPAAQGRAGEARDLRDGWKRAEKRLILAQREIAPGGAAPVGFQERRLILAQREIARLRAELAEAGRGEQLRREAWLQLLDEKDEEIRRLNRALEDAAAGRTPLENLDEV